MTLRAVTTSTAPASVTRPSRPNTTSAPVTAASRRRRCPRNDWRVPAGPAPRGRPRTPPSPARRWWCRRGAGGGATTPLPGPSAPGGGRWDGPHPLAQLLALVGEAEEIVRRVLELGRPEQRVERADVDADAAVHAQRVVDREPVEDVAHAWSRTLTRRGLRLLVRVDVDAPV